MATKTETEVEEGARRFGTTLEHLDDGRFQHELSALQHELVKALEAHAADHTSAKGSLTIKLEYKLDKNGVCEVKCDAATKAPKANRGVSIFWATKGSNLSPENPRQQKLPLKDVSGPNAVREAAAPRADVRGA